MSITISQSELEARIAEAKKLQTRSSGNGGNAQGHAVYEILKKEGRILSTDPRLAALNPKYPTDAVWTYCAKNMVAELASDGFYITASGRKPTVYRLVPLPSVKVTAPTPSVTGQATQTPAKTGN